MSGSHDVMPSSNAFDGHVLTARFSFVFCRVFFRFFFLWGCWTGGGGEKVFVKDLPDGLSTADLEEAFSRWKARGLYPRRTPVNTIAVIQCSVRVG